MRHVIFAFIAAVLFGTTGTAQALGPEDAASLSVGSARIVIGGLALALVAWLLSRRSPTALRDPMPGSPTSDMLTLHIPNSPEPEPQAPPAVVRRRHSWPVVVIGAAAIVAYQPAFFLGTSINGVAIGTVVAIGSGPIITGLLEWALTRRSPGIAWFVATVVAIVGIVLLSGVGEAGATGAADAGGILLSLAAGACYAVYALSAKQLLIEGWTPTGSVALIFGWSAVGALPFLLLTDLSWLATGTGILMALWLGLVTITVACLFLANGLKALSASTVTTLGLGEPVTATLLGVVILHEVLSGRAIVGLALVAFGLVLIGLLRAKQPGAPA